MKLNYNIKMASRRTWFPYGVAVKSVVISALMLAGMQSSLQAQETTYTRPSWWFGAAAGANLNFYRGSMQELNADITAPVAFHRGFGAGLYVAPLVEWHRPKTVWGVMMQIGYDSRRGKFKQVVSPCNCPRDLSTNLGYITFEPSLRIAPFKNNFYLFIGPRMAINVQKSFTYKQSTNPEFPEQVAEADVKADFSNVSKALISMQVGAGYDFPLSSQKKKTQVALGVFASYHPYFGQNPRSMETWNVSTLRVGAALKFGCGKKISKPSEVSSRADVVIINSPVVQVAEPKVVFSVYAPKNIPAERRVREIFPLRNYVFFDLGSTEIPSRYVLLKKGEVKDFKEDQLDQFTPKNLSGRSKRQMVVYYNVINILGDRMGKNPSATIVLVGSSEKGPEDGRAMAESVKQYLVNVFGIDASRISTEGREKPKLPSEKPGSTDDLTLLREGDRRVSIESSSPVLLMEFQSGPGAPLKPVEIIAVQEAPLDSYVSFNVEGGNEAFSSWSLEITDEKGKVQYIGPYNQERVSIPGKYILGTRSSGDFKVKMIGKTKNGKTVMRETSVHMVLWTPPKNEEGMRFSVIFEFDESKAIAIYEKYLTEIVSPKIPQNGTVIIHGHSDIIGDEDYNHRLSHERANEVKSIIENALSKAGRSDVKFEVYGFGEDENSSPFENKFPEERFYNRTVVIDIIPGQ